jgi:hypothetical protein
MPSSGITTGVDTGLDIEGARIQAAVKQATTPKGTLTAAKSSPTGIPIPGTPFLVSSVSITKKGRIRGEFQAVLPDNSKKLTTVIVPTGQRDTDAHYKAGMLTDTIRVDQDVLAANAGQYLYVFNPLLESLTQYDLLQLVVEADNQEGGSTEVANPESLPAYNDASPLAQFTTGSVVGGPSDPAANQIVLNRLDPLTKKFDAEMRFRVYAPLDASGNAQSWQAYLGGDVICVLDLGAGPDHGTNYTITGSDTLTDPASPIKPNRGYVEIPRKKLTPGAAGTWIKNIVNVNGEKAVSNSTNIAFFAGNLNLSIQNLAAVNLVAQSGDPNDAKHEKLILELRQGTPVGVALKNCTVEMKVQGDPDASYKVVVHKFSLKEDDYQTPGQLYSTANGLGVVINQSLKMKPGVTYVLRLTLKAIGDVIYYANPNTLTLPTFTILAGADPNVTVDSDVPTLAINPVTTTTGPTVHERFAVVKVTCLPAATNGNTTDDYEAVLSTSTSPPAGDPTVGSEGVLAIDHGQKAVFDIALTAPLTIDFYFYYRIHNKSGIAHAPASAGWSSWSTWTNQHGYSHPVEASIGPGVPVWSMALERANTGGVGGNTTQKYYLDSGASSVTDAYTGSGVGGGSLHWAVYINDAGVAAADRVRLVIFSGQDGGGKYVLTNTVFSSAPGNSLPYELHRGVCAAGKSGNGHSTTTFILDRNADAYISTTSHDYDGMSLYLPTVTGGQQVQKVTNSIYNSGTGFMTLTIEPAAGFAALGGSPANGTPYMLCAGGFGYAASDASGTISPVPFRTWRDSSDASNVQIQVEMILPLGEDTFNLVALQVQVNKATATPTLRYDDKIPPATTTTYRFFAFSAKVATIRVRLRNFYRGTPAKGWSDWSVYGVGNASGDTPTAYTPATYTPPDSDFVDEPYYPSSRYSLAA